jgi:ligand-binding sensor domain-containing protein
MVVAAARPASADAPYALLNGYTMTSWTATDGSAIGPVYSLVQDRDGYLWIGTTGGIVRFDGARFTRWETIYGAPLPRADVRALTLSRDGTLWAGFDRIGGGVTVAALRGGTAVSVTKGSPPREAVTSLIEDHAGTVWAVGNSVLYRLRGGAWEVIRHGALGHAAVVSVREDARGCLWIGTRQGVFRTTDGESFELVAEGIARETSDGADGALWMTDPAHGVRRHGASGPLVGMDGWGNRLLHDSRGNLWVGTTGQGLWRLRAGAAADAPLIELATNQTGLSSNAVQTLLEDRDGNLWVGTMLGAAQPDAAAAHTARRRHRGAHGAPRRGRNRLGRHRERPAAVPAPGRHVARSPPRPGLGHPLAVSRRLGRRVGGHRRRAARLERRASHPVAAPARHRAALLGRRPAGPGQRDTDGVAAGVRRA